LGNKETKKILITVLIKRIWLFFQVDACAHPFFDELRDPKTCLSNGRSLPPLFDFSAAELEGLPVELVHRIIPEHMRK
jgi:hypothetical protein